MTASDSLISHLRLAPFWSELNCDWVSVLYYKWRPVGQSSWNKAPIWGLRPDFYYSQTVANLLIWGAFSDESMGLSFTIAAGPRQRSHSWVRVPWDSRPYFLVSDLRLSFLSPSTTLRSTVEVFDPASTRDELWLHLGFLLYSVCVSTETPVGHPYPVRLPVTGWFPRMQLHGNVLANSFPSNGSKCYNTYIISL
jgi:hypothetical protein